MQRRQHLDVHPRRMTKEVSAVVQHHGKIAVRARRHHPLRVLPLALRKAVLTTCGASPVAISFPLTREPAQAATSVSQPRAASSRSSVQRICSAPPALASLTGSSG